jgi:hypothetical protein
VGGSHGQCFPVRGLFRTKTSQKLAAASRWRTNGSKPSARSNFATDNRQKNGSPQRHGGTEERLFLCSSQCLRVSVLNRCGVSPRSIANEIRTHGQNSIDREAFLTPDTRHLTPIFADTPRGQGIQSTPNRVTPVIADGFYRARAGWRDAAGVATDSAFLSVGSSPPSQ